MPYIDSAAKYNVVQHGPSTAGELNYQLTMTCLNYLDTLGQRYQTYNDIMGALEGCKLELYRRSISKYEDGAIKRNGDVYE